MSWEWWAIYGLALLNIGQLYLLYRLGKLIVSIGAQMPPLQRAVLTLLKDGVEVRQAIDDLNIERTLSP